jgi:hypothetical protein
VLVAPQNKIQELRQHLFMNTCLVHQATQIALMAILMKHHYIKPLLGLARGVKANLLILKSTI